MKAFSQSSKGLAARETCTQALCCTNTSKTFSCTCPDAAQLHQAHQHAGVAHLHVTHMPWHHLHRSHERRGGPMTL